jgi:ferritin
MIEPSVEKLLNEQIMHEFFSEYLYEAMAAAMYEKGWVGAAHWLHVQAGEEKGHAMRFYNHMVDRNGHIELLALEKPQAEWTDPLQVMKAAYEHEKFITGKINDLMALAKEKKDYPAEVMLQWFVIEQEEEEKSTFDAARMLERVNENPAAMLMADKVLGKRE